MKPHAPPVARSSFSSLAITLAALASFGAAACSDDATDDPMDQNSGGSQSGSASAKGGSTGTKGGSGGSSSKPAEGGSDGEGGAGAAPAADPAYLYTVAVYAPDGTLQYSLVRSELNVEIGVDDLAQAHEFPGYTGVAAIGGHVITGDSETPFATKWEIGEDLSWKQVGNKLNFADYFTGDADGLNFYFQSIRGSDMYFFYGADRTSRVHWNIDGWKIVGDHQDTNLPTPPAGWSLGSTGNRTGVRDFVGPVLQTFNMSEDETGLGSDKSWIALYDPETHEEKDVIDVPCPGLQQSTLDEEGNAYVSTTFNMPTRALYGVEPASCVVKVKPDGTLDEAFGYNDLRDLTGGYYGVNFRYLADGKAVANVLHDDRVTDADFASGVVDPAVEIAIGGQWTDEGYIQEDTTFWELHLIDLEAGTSQIIEGFAAEHDVSYYTIFFQVDGHTFVSVQHDVESITHNAMYELDLDSATVTPAGEVVGDLAGIERVR